MKNKKTIIIAACAAALLAAAAWFVWGRKKPFEATYNSAEVTRGSISTSVTATGTIEPITQVEVGTQVSGIVNKIYVDYNSVVRKGQVIAELDKVNLQNDLRSQQSNLATCQTEYEYQKKEYDRVKELHDKQMISDSEYDQAYYNYQKSKNSLEVAKLNVAKAETNLGYATIYAPIDGVVLSKSVEEGQTVASSFNTPTLFVIAEDLTQMRVIADVDEADIGNVAEGQRVVFTVDAYPNEQFEGSVVQVRQEAASTNNVVTYEVVINAPNDSLRLKPGLTASVTIYTREVQDALIVPGKALHFTPSPALIGPGDTIIDCEARHKVWTREGRTMRAHAVEVGMSTGSQTEIKSGLTEGMRVVTEIVSGQMPGQEADDTPQTSQEKSPFMPGRPGGRGR